LFPKANQHIRESKYICDQNSVKFPTLVREIWCSQGFWDAQTHSLTERPEYSMPMAPFFNGGGGTTTCVTCTYMYNLLTL